MQNDWITIGEAADLLQVSRDTLRRWEKKGKINSYRSPSNRRMYKRSEITEAYQQSADDGEDLQIETPVITLASTTFKQHPTPVSISSSNYTISNQTNDNPFTSPGSTILKSSSESPYQNNPEIQETISSHNSNINSSWSPTMTYKKPIYLQNLTPTSTVSNKPTPVSSKIPPIQTSNPKPETLYSSLKDFEKPNLISNDSIATNPPSPIKSQVSVYQEIPQIPNPHNNPEASQAHSQQETFFSYPSIVNTNQYPIDYKNFQDYSLEPMEEKSDNTIKILKIITAILITILIVLGVSIFAIIFMQYR